MASSAANKIAYLLATKIIDFSADVFKIILMQSGYTFDRDDDHGYADVSGSELANGNGYVTGGATLSGVAITEDDTNDWSKILWNNASWVASGASLTASGAIIYDTSVAAPVANPIVGYIDFGGDQTVVDGATFTIANPQVRIRTSSA